MSIQRILVPIDYSKNSERGLNYAAELALRFAAELDVVHVWDRPTYISDAILARRPGGTHQPLGELIRENAEKDMNDYLVALRLDDGRAALELPHRLLAGEPASALLAELKAGGHELMVIGTHGRTGFAHFVLGSVAEKLVRLSPVPVLTVPPPERGWKA
jgi:universal stress protein A